MDVITEGKEAKENAYLRENENFVAPSMQLLQQPVQQLHFSTLTHLTKNGSSSDLISAVKVYELR
jgi:hypothetical protein